MYSTVSIFSTSLRLGSLYIQVLGMTSRISVCRVKFSCQIIPWRRYKNQRRTSVVDPKTDLDPKLFVRLDSDTDLPKSHQNIQGRFRGMAYLSRDSETDLYLYFYILGHKSQGGYESS